jgi:hypothetical protein
LTPSPPTTLRLIVTLLQGRSATLMSALTFTRDEALRPHLAEPTKKRWHA